MRSLKPQGHRHTTRPPFYSMPALTPSDTKVSRHRALPMLSSALQLAAVRRSSLPRCSTPRPRCSSASRASAAAKNAKSAHRPAVRGSRRRQLWKKCQERADENSGSGGSHHSTCTVTFFHFVSSRRRPLRGNLRGVRTVAVLYPFSIHTATEAASACGDHFAGPSHCIFFTS